HRLDPLERIPSFPTRRSSDRIDVRRAHRAGPLPLPARVVRDGVITIVVDPGPGSAPAVEKRVVATGERVPDSVPVRVTRWKSSLDRKSTRLNSSHVKISYAVF